MRLTSQQELILRQRPQSTKLWLSIYIPKTLMACQISGTFSSGEMQISIDSVSTGSYLNVPANVVGLIGTSPGASDVGRLRVKNITGSYVTFAENEVVWQNNFYLTFIDFVDINPVYPRIIQDPSNQANVIFYKDWDIPYSNQNSIYGTFPCAGPHRAGFITTGSYGTYYSSTGSYNVKGDSLTFNWAFEGGTPSGSTLRDPGLVQYTSPGDFRTRLIITSSSGAVDTAYRYVSAYQRPEDGTRTPILKWELTNFSGSRGEGGYTVGIRLMQDIGLIEPNALVVIFAEDQYGGTITSLGGNSENNSSIVFVGYVVSDSIKFDYKQSTVDFELGSISDVLKRTEGFSVSCESVPTASRWYELSEMTVQKALYHYLRWHTTVLNICDFQYTGDDRFVQYFDADRESLWDSVDNFIRNGLLGETVVDRQGKIWAEIAPYGLVSPFTTIPDTVPTLDKQDWMDEPSITERRVSDASFIELGGIAYYGVTSNTFSALLTNAPGNAPLYRGKSERQEGLILLSQLQLNQVGGNYLAHKNSSFPEISMSLNGDYRNFDIAPQEKIYLIINQSDTVRNISLRNMPYRMSSMTWMYDSTKQSFHPDITLEQIVTGTIGQTLLIPLTPPDGGFAFPEFSLPSFPVFNSQNTPGPNAPMGVIMKDSGAGSVGLLYTADFDAVSPQWITVNAGLTQAQYQAINFLFVTPSGGIYVGFGDKTTNDFIAYAPSIGSTFSIINSGNKIWGVGYNPSLPDYIVILMEQAGSQFFWSITGGVFTQGGATSITPPGSDMMDITFGNNCWILAAFDTWYKLDAAGLNVVSNGSIGSGPATNSKRAITSKYLVYDRNGVTGMVITADDFATNTLITDAQMANSAFMSNLAIDPTGMFMMAPYGAGEKGRSSDGGATWFAIPNLPPGGAYAFAFAGGSSTTSRWIAARGVVRFSPDFGSTIWINKEGNLTTVVPFPVITIVRAIGYSSG